jgi:hypothetical protein
LNRMQLLVTSHQLVETAPSTGTKLFSLRLKSTNGYIFAPTILSSLRLSGLIPFSDTCHLTLLPLPKPRTI